MCCIFLCLVTYTFVLLLTGGYAVYNKDVVCFIDEGQHPVCTAISSPTRRANDLKNEPIYDPYIPRRNPIFYECSESNCNAVEFSSITQLTSPELNISSCSFELTYNCENIRFNYFKNVDKLLFLSNIIPYKKFYLVDCLLYSDGARVCQKKDTQVKLRDFGTLVRENERNILSQDEFICEEDANELLCDLNPYVPFEKGLKKKELLKNTNEILLRSGHAVVKLKYYCLDHWCGYKGEMASFRRAIMSRQRYEPPGGKIYRCFYANRQQICKRIPNDGRNMYNDRDWSTP
ncbi:uncharacterized protein [Battus philenor]|uniref:uncharacterized protein n=1 Tax=Battus philenor TaxID=42288 RepID=UPI0035CFC5D2